MAAHGWRNDHPLAETLFEEAWRFDFFQTVRLLEILFPERRPVGEGARPEEETVRFHADVSFDFPASPVSAVRPPGKDGPAHMDTPVMGLAGLSGPLPSPYTQLILDRYRKKDRVFKDFLDIFNHRLISLFYRVRKTSRIGFRFESPEKSPFSAYLFSFMGLGTPGLLGRTDVKDRAFLYYTGLVSQQPHSMAGLTTLIADYIGAPCRGVPLAGKWLPVASDQLTRVGVRGRNRILGESALVGRRVWSQESSFRLLIGPLKQTTFLDLLPVGSAWGGVSQIIRFYVGDTMDYDMTLIVLAEEVPAGRLGRRTGSLLGWTSWLSGKGPRVREGEVALNPGRVAKAMKPGGCRGS